MSSPKHRRVVITNDIWITRLVALIAINLILIHAASSSPSASSSAATQSRHHALNSHHLQSRRRQFNKPFLIHASLKNDAELSLQSNDKVLERLRGGAAFLGRRSNQNGASDGNGTKSLAKKTIGQNENVELENKSKIQAAEFATTAIAIFAIALSIFHWDTIKASLSTFFDKERFRTAIIQRLNDIASQGNKGLLLYTFGFVFWEVCGLPTSVVETAAAMAFGFQRGLLGSFVGKTCGSVLAFALGRTLLSNIVSSKMSENQSFDLIQRGVAQKPMLSALVLRYSPFPELVKNFALSVTKPVTVPMFVAAISIHGFPFSLLWAALGNDSSLRLRASEAGETMAANVVLNGLVVFVMTVFGFVVSPAITGWWLAGLRKENADLS